MTRIPYRIPSSEELYALEHEARRLRAAAIAKSLGNAARSVRAFFARPASATTRSMRHA